jgi:hypothetical protein
MCFWAVARIAELEALSIKHPYGISGGVNLLAALEVVPY